MEHTTVRVQRNTHTRIRALAEQSGASMQSIIEQAIELLERRRFLEGVNRSYAALRQDEAEWMAIREERAEWDTALADGLDAETSDSEGRRGGREDHGGGSDQIDEGA